MRQTKDIVVMLRFSVMARLCAALALFAALVTPIAQSRPAAAQGHGTSVDLPAIIFTAADLAEAGFDGYRVDSAGPYDMAADAAYISDAQNLDLAEVEETFAEAGHQGSYVMLYKLPADPDDPAGPPLRELQTSAYLFADAESAEAAYEVIADESQNGGADIDNAGLGIGDASELTTLTSSADVNYGLPNTQIELEIRYDRLVLEVSTFNYDPDTAGLPIFESDEMANIEALGERLVERAEAALAGETPNLSTLILPIERDQALGHYLVYELIDGAGVRQSHQTEETFEEGVERRRESGTVAVLRSEQYLSEPIGETGELRLYLGLLAFESERDAIAYMEGLVDRFSENPRYTNVEGEQIPDLGDQATALALDIDNEGETLKLNELFVRVGELAFGIWIEQPERTADSPVVSVDALVELGTAEVACLEDGGCDDPVPMPDELAEIIGGAGAEPDETAPDGDDQAESTGDEDADEDDAPAGDDLEIYESPQYGYVLEYDPAEWAAGAADGTPNDDYDQLSLEHELGFVTLIGDPDYAEDALGDCVDDYRSGLEQTEGVDRVRKMRGESGEEEDRAWAAFTYDFDTGEGEPLEVARYIECRAAADVTIVVLQTSLEEDYAELSAARNELLEGLE